MQFSLKLKGPGGVAGGLDLLTEEVAIVDERGRIVTVNAAWCRFAEQNGAPGTVVNTYKGTNYLEICDRAAARGCADAGQAAALIRSVIHGHAGDASMEYQCDAPHEPRWFRMKVSMAATAEATATPRFIISHERVAYAQDAARQIRMQASVLASIEQAAIATDLAGTIVFWNRFAEQLYGWRCEEVMGRNIVAVLPSEASAEQARHIMASLNRGESWRGDFDVRHRDGHRMLIRVKDTPLRDEHNHLIGIIGISTDIGEQKQQEKALGLSELVYEALGEAIMVVGMDGGIVAINPAFTRRTAYGEAEAVGKHVDLLRPAGAEHFFPADAAPSLARTGHWAGTIHCRRRCGLHVQDWLRIDTIYDPHGREKLRVCMFSPVTDQKRAKETIWHQANFDSLTNLPNRSLFRDRLEHELQRAARDKCCLALMFIDIDQFKEVNDTLGHDTGDLLLREAAVRLLKCVRLVDTVARLGGDEFTVILGHLDNLDVVDRVARELVRAMAEPFHIGENTIHVSASVGITSFPNDGGDCDSLIKNADQAMYAAKNGGRNQFHYFTARMQHEAQLRMHLVNDLRLALARREFELFYQPIVDLNTGAIHKAEALLRWHHPTRGIVEPADFVAIAEQTGLICEIGAWAMAEAQQQAARWRASIDPDFQISVNVSPLQLRTNDHALPLLAARHKDSEHASGARGAAVIVELTEGLLLEGSECVNRHLQSLRDDGIELAIDDFGTGYSSLSYLQRFHVDYLKIDRSFVSRLAAQSDQLAMCDAIIVMAHKLGIKVIAEGIERPEQRDLLARAGCDYGQGYLFSGPACGAAIGKLLAAAAAGR